MVREETLNRKVVGLDPTTIEETIHSPFIWMNHVSYQSKINLALLHMR